MKDLIKLILIFCVFFSSFSFAIDSVKPHEASSVWGQIVKSDKFSSSGFEYYVLFNDEKSQQVAYPIIPTTKITAQTIEQYVGTMARIKGNVKAKKFYSGEFKKSVAVFEVISIEKLELNQLGIQKITINNDNLPNTPAPQEKTKTNNSGGITINDNLANTLIFAGGAAILGKILFDVIKGH